MKGIYRYSIIRFRPFAETGEFANIGIIVFDLTSGQARFRLARKRFARIGHFFDQETHRAYSNAVEGLRIELPRLIEYVPETFSRSAIDQFSDLFGSRESSILFSTPRVIKSSSGLDNVADDLFDRFVKRDFDKAIDPESVLAKDIRRALHRLGIKHFKSLKIHDEIVPISFPLGHRGHKTAAIKPLAFRHKSPLHVVDYGAHWKRRLSYHLENKNLEPDSVFLAVEGPSDNSDDQFYDAFQLALDELRELPFEVKTVADEIVEIPPELAEFVSRFPPLQSQLLN